MAVSSPARSAEEVAEMALERGYTTIVAVGGDLMVNRLANVLAGTQAALGVIPYELSPEIGQLFCGSDLKTACNGLKQRKTTFIDLGTISPDKYFLSDIYIKTEKPVRLNLDVDDKYTINAEIYDLNITRKLEVEFLTQQIGQASSWWSRANKTNNSSVTKFQAKKYLDIATNNPVSVYINNDFEVVKTPIKVSRAKEVLKIIVNRDTIN